MFKFLNKFRRVDTNVPDRLAHTKEPPFRETFREEHYRDVVAARGFIGRVPDYLTPLLGKKVVEREMPVIERKPDYTETVLGLKWDTTIISTISEQN
jgi:hypothetical protein